MSYAKLGMAAFGAAAAYGMSRGRGQSARGRRAGRSSISEVDTLIRRAQEADLSPASAGVLANIIGQMRDDPQSDYYRPPPKGPGRHIPSRPLGFDDLSMVKMKLRRLIESGGQGRRAPRSKRPVRAFVEGVRSGYAYGLKDADDQDLLWYLVKDDGTQKGMHRAYREAIRGAHSLWSTFKKKPRMIYERIEQQGVAKKRAFASWGSSARGRRAGKKPTYAKARKDILAYLGTEGWDLSSPSLKVPHATSPGGSTRLYFKAQSVHLDDGGKPFSLGASRSMWLDIRELTPHQFLGLLNRRMQRGSW